MVKTITIAGQEFFDITGFVSEDRYTRPKTDGYAIHHSVAQTEFPDKNFNGTNQDEELAHINAINNYHIQQGYGGFGYNAIAFQSGRVYVVGTGRGSRAHVANHNNHLEGICMAGTFSMPNQEPAFGITLGVGRWLAAKFKQTGLHAVKGHGQWVTDPAWASSCPGLGGAKGIQTSIKVAQAIINGNEAELAKKAQELITKSLEENWRTANLAGLATQIAWLTGNKLCGAK